MTDTTETLVRSIRAGVKARKAYEAYVTEHSVTRDSVTEHAKALAALAFPKDENVQKVNGIRTEYGNAVQLAAYHLRSVIGSTKSSDTDKADTDWLALATQAVTNAAENGVGIDTLTTMLAETLRPYTSPVLVAV